MKNTMAIVWVLFGLVGSTMAADPTGSWKSTFLFHEQQVENLLNLRLDSEGPTLTGGFLDGSSRREVPITAARFNRGELTFSVVREAGGQRFAVRHSGQLVGDTITGKAIIDYGDRTHTTEWIAKRQK